MPRTTPRKPPRTPVEKLGLSFLSLTLALALGCAIFLVASGTRPGAPFVFVVGAALALGASLYLLARSAMSVVVEPQADEMRVATGRRKKELEREKQLLLKALKELGFDHEMRKISDADYEEIAGSYRARAVRIMRQLDEGAAAYKKQIEDELGARRAKKSAADESKSEKATPAIVPDKAHDDLDDDAQDDDHACASCGTANDPDAVFCKKCGRRVIAEAAE